MVTEITNEKEVRELPEFNGHHAVFRLENKEAGFRGYIAIHRKNGVVPSFGATRMWHYQEDRDALRDALRLSRGMSYKAALAGLACGGAKGVISLSTQNADREKMLREYSRHVDMLAGKFITGTDVGLKQEDLKIMREETPYIVGFNDNSTYFTALGVFCAIEACLSQVFGKGDVAERSFAVQGAGNIGSAIIEMLYQKGCRDIRVSELDGERLATLKNKFPEIKIVAPEEIHREKVDVLCPCALSHTVNPSTIEELGCRIVAGGANNQLETDDLGEHLRQKNILYAPDYVANAGGLISVFDEYTNRNQPCDRTALDKKVREIKETLQNIFKASAALHKATNLVANEMAEARFNAYAAEPQLSAENVL